MLVFFIHSAQGDAALIPIIYIIHVKRGFIYSKEYVRVKANSRIVRKESFPVSSIWIQKTFPMEGSCHNRPFIKFSISPAMFFLARDSKSR